MSCNCISSTVCSFCWKKFGLVLENYNLKSIARVLLEHLKLTAFVSYTNAIHRLGWLLGLFFSNLAFVELNLFLFGKYVVRPSVTSLVNSSSLSPLPIGGFRWVLDVCQVCSGSPISAFAPLRQIQSNS